MIRQVTKTEKGQSRDRNQSKHGGWRSKVRRAGDHWPWEISSRVFLDEYLERPFHRNFHLTPPPPAQCVTKLATLKVPAVGSFLWWFTHLIKSLPLSGSCRDTSSQGWGSKELYHSASSLAASMQNQISSSNYSAIDRGFLCLEKVRKLFIHSTNICGGGKNGKKAMMEVHRKCWDILEEESGIWAGTKTHLSPRVCVYVCIYVYVFNSFL